MSNELTGPLAGWRGLSGINWLGFALVGDAYSNVVAVSDFNNFTEYGQVMQLTVTTPPLQKDRKYIFVTRFEIDMQVGDGLPSAPSGAGTVSLAVSRDGGMTYGQLLRPRSMGQVGEYRTRIRWLNLGRGRQWVFKLLINDPVRRQIIGTYWDGYSSV
jgi:hypothetical protein